MNPFSNTQGIKTCAFITFWAPESAASPPLLVDVDGVLMSFSSVVNVCEMRPSVQQGAALSIR